MHDRKRPVKNGQEIIGDARDRGHEVNIGNQDLPTYPFMGEIAASIRDNVFTVLLGETGSGKTTQAPQVAFSIGKTVDHTQPRRSTAHEAALRIQEELASSIPDLHGQTVAVHTAEECTVSDETQITIMTDGMLLAVGYNPKSNRLDRSIDGNVTILDEVHEGNKNMELLLGLIMKEAKTNPGLRVVLMTATPNKDFMISRIEEITGIAPNVIEVPGRTYPVERIERPELNSVEATLEYLEPGEGYLVFKAGIGEIKDTIKEIKAGLPKRFVGKVDFFIYHSTISSRELSVACHYEPVDGRIKVVVGTNAMESGLSIKGIKYVIDDGTAREVSLNERGHEGLYLVPISQDRCLQRAGRAGRFSPGKYILTRADANTPFISLADRPKHDTPEILRLDLKNEVLTLAALGIDFGSFEIINQDDNLAGEIRRAKESLAIIGALDSDGKITEIGLEMNKYPVRATLKRTIVESKKYSQDIQIMIAALAAAVESGGLPMYGRYSSNEWKEIGDESSSDLLRQLDLFIATRQLSPSEQNKIGINPKNVKKARETYEKILHQLGIKDTDLSYPNELQREEMIRCIYAGHVEYIFQKFGRNLFRLLDDTDAVVYRLSDRSVVDPRHSQMVVGLPRVVERVKRGKTEQRSIIESVTVVPAIEQLGEAAVNMAAWSPEEVVWRNGRVFKITEQSIRGVRTGQQRETMGDKTDVIGKHRELVAYVLEHPGPAQQILRAIKKELERLNHLSKDGVTRVTQDALLEFIDMAIKNSTIPDAHHVDNELMLIIQQNEITLNTYVSAIELNRIIENAPDEIKVGAQVLTVEYRNGVPKVKRYDPSFILSLQEDVCLPDGRNVRFVYEKRELRAMDLKKALLDKH